MSDEDATCIIVRHMHIHQPIESRQPASNHFKVYTIHPHLSYEVEVKYIADDPKDDVLVKEGSL